MSFMTSNSGVRESRIIRKMDENMKIQQDAEDLEWIREVDSRMYIKQRYVTLLALLGLFVSVIIRETCMRRPMDEKCGGAFISLLKVFTTITTILLLFFMWQQMELALEGEDAQQRLIDRDHRIVADFRLARQTFFQRLMRTVRSNWFTWSILFPLNMIHPVPGFSKTWTIEQLGIQPSYRVESLISAVMLIRIYHIFVLIKLRLLTKYLSLDSSLIIRNENAIKQMNDPSLSQPVLAVKIALTRQPMYLISTCWAVLIFSATWIIRISENTPGNLFSVYLWDQLWLVMVTSTTTGYGDLVPHTHFGRIGGMLCMTAGPILISIMTATFSRSMTLNPQETRLMRTLDGDKMQSHIVVAAVRMIQLWWRGRMRILWFNPNNEMSMRRLLDLEDEDHVKGEQLFCELMEAQQRLKRFKNQAGYHSIGEAMEEPQEPHRKRDSVDRNSSSIANALMLAYQQQKGTSLKEKVSLAGKQRGSEDSKMGVEDEIQPASPSGGAGAGGGGGRKRTDETTGDKSELNHRDYLAALSTLSDQVGELRKVMIQQGRMLTTLSASVASIDNTLHSLLPDVHVPKKLTEAAKHSPRTHDVAERSQSEHVPNARPQPSPRTPRRSKSEEHHAIPLNGGAMKIFSGHQGEHSQTADLVFDSCSPSKGRVNLLPPRTNRHSSEEPVSNPPLLRSKRAFQEFCSRPRAVPSASDRLLRLWKEAGSFKSSIDRREVEEFEPADVHRKGTRKGR
mmetsp:Transcript_18413/g.41954  ORF Transcript_18413/g.41954 Transcript_18413/m.41954 type:complete len:736 (-) Transcript_18413:58-2265(-)